ncbi:MAG: DUF1549 and DUF1553 domain-containing protein [Planctomycetes bacterium]|nr:DUF1549 and DUF1553 domain-containing protein [Planctomycetota bacterium]
MTPLSDRRALLGLRRVLGLLALFALVSPATAGEAIPETASASGPDFRATAARVDELLAARWREEGVTPATLSDDSEFLRRVYLDLTGVIPPVAEVRAFLNDDSADKRQRLIERLLASPAHATHLATTWRNIMLPAGFETGDLNSVLGVQNWLRNRFAENMRYDRIASELLVATGGSESGPALFYTALELKPEELAANTARIFLGVQIQCAQCHDHPYDHWSQEDFWGYAAFFAQLERAGGEQPGMMNVALVDRNQGDVTLPDTEQVVLPRYPEGRLANPDEGGYRRQQLSIWLASRDNPYLARAMANRVWERLFGRGLVEPVDDLGPRNPPSHPEILEELTEFFIESGFDVRMLFRTLANTRAYQLSSRGESEEAPRPELFARMMVKSLTPEQLYDSLSQAALRNSVGMGMGGASSSRLFDPQRREFLARMQTASRSAAEFEAGLPQALMLMNGRVMVEATDSNKSRMIAALDAPWFTDEQRLETLFLAAYAREPSDAERDQFLNYIRGADENNRRQALGDVFWALLNSAEFALNH